jgi:hypothetical protein
MEGVRAVPRWWALAAAVFAAAWLFTVPGIALAQTASPTPQDAGAPTNGECVVCHALPQVVDRPDGINRGLYVTQARIQDSVHESLTCTDCHSPYTATGHPANDRAASACADCHEDAAAQWAAGAHGKPSDLGVPPTCVTCHGNHDVQPADRAFAEAVAVKCAACHATINEHAFGSNPLGMETHLGRVDVATCADCHEPHEVLPPDDPASSVNPRNKLSTCRRCHTDAPAHFADIEIHVASGPLPGDLKLRFATLWMLGILIFTFAFFGWLTVLGIRYEWRHGRVRPAEPGAER